MQLVIRPVVVLCIALLTLRVTDRANCFKGGKIVVGALGLTWLMGQVGGPLCRILLMAPGRPGLALAVGVLTIDEQSEWALTEYTGKQMDYSL